MKEIPQSCEQRCALQLFYLAFSCQLWPSFSWLQTACVCWKILQERHVHAGEHPFRTVLQLGLYKFEFLQLHKKILEEICLSNHFISSLFHGYFNAGRSGLWAAVLSANPSVRFCPHYLPVFFPGNIFFEKPITLAVKLYI